MPLTHKVGVDSGVGVGVGVDSGGSESESESESPGNPSTPQPWQLCVFLLTNNGRIKGMSFPLSTHISHPRREVRGRRETRRPVLPCAGGARRSGAPALRPPPSPLPPLYLPVMGGGALQQEPMGAGHGSRDTEKPLLERRGDGRLGGLAEVTRRSIVGPVTPDT